MNSLIALKFKPKIQWEVASLLLGVMERNNPTTRQAMARESNPEEMFDMPTPVVSDWVGDRLQLLDKPVGRMEMVENQETILPSQTILPWQEI